MVCMVDIQIAGGGDNDGADVDNWGAFLLKNQIGFRIVVVLGMLDGGDDDDVADTLLTILVILIHFYSQVMIKKFH